MMDADDFILTSVLSVSMSAVLFIGILTGVAGVCPNNTALYLSVLVWPAGLLTIISAIITAVSTCKRGATWSLKGFVAWWALAILSSGFMIAAIAVLDAADGLADNPHLIWN